LRYAVGIDTGGTFTDVTVLDDDGTVVAGKAPTTPADLTEGIFDSLTHAAGQLDLDFGELLSQIRVLRFSGTTATNALLTRGGDVIGMITTGGFEDTLAIGRANTSWVGLGESDLRRVHRHRAPEPLVARAMIRGVRGRIDAAGSEVVGIDPDEVERVADELVEAGAKAIAVCLLWSIRSGDHERRAKELIAARHPDLPVHCSHEIAPAVGEYERFSTTAIDAYVSPALTRFLANFGRRLADGGFGGELLIAQADGGALHSEDARPVFTLHSGPAGGVIASRGEGQRIGYGNVVTTDVGGTSFDVGLVADGDWIYAREPELGGHHLSVPMIEVASIGAGGGSIAWADELGVLHVGPRSAGSTPGPACYGRGGTEPTVTDADLLLGYLDPSTFLGGRMDLDVEAAEAALGRLAERVGLEPLETAAGIFAIANAHMGDLLARQVVARGYDPRDFVVFAYGGAGPMHSAFYAADAGVSEVVVPAQAGTFSSLGVATAPILHSQRSHTFAQMPVSPAEFNAALVALEQPVVEALDKDGVAAAQREISYVLEMRYGMQVHTVRLEIPRKEYAEKDIEALAELFDQTYERLYGAGSGYPQAGRFLTGYIVDGYGHVPVPQPRSEAAADSGAERALLGTREAFFGGEFVATGIYRYELMGPGDAVEGPAIIEAASTTVVVPPGATGALDAQRNVRLTGLADLRRSTNSLTAAAG
jgi:N-methylhydantoinase A